MIAGRPRPRRSPRAGRAISALLATGLGGCGGGEPTAAVSPAAWAAVEQAGAPARASGPPDELTRALALIEVAGLPGSLYPVDRADALRLAGTLPDDAAVATDALVRWSDAEGRLPTRECLPGPATFRMLALAQVALLVAGEEPDAPEVRAVVDLAARLRAEGNSLAEGMVGTMIADQLREWAGVHAWSPAPVARRYQPDDVNLRRVVAAEAVCAMSMADGIRWPRDPALDAAWPPIRVWGPMLGAGARARLQAAWLALLADPFQGAGARRDVDPRAATAATIARLRSSDQAYRAWLAGAP